MPGNEWGDLAADPAEWGDLAEAPAAKAEVVAPPSPKAEPGLLNSAYSGYESAKITGLKALVDSARALMGKGKAPTLDSIGSDFSATKGAIQQVAPEEAERIKASIPNKAASALAGYTYNVAAPATALFGSAPSYGENLTDAQNYYKQAIDAEPEANFVGSLLSPAPGGKAKAISKIANPVVKAATRVGTNGALAAGQSALSDYALDGEVNGKRALTAAGVSSAASLLPSIVSPVAKYVKNKMADKIALKAASAADDKIASNLGKFDETLQNKFYKPAEKTLENPDPSIPLELLGQADDVNRTRLTNGTEEFSRNMQDFGGKLPERPVPPREQMIANEVDAMNEGSSLTSKLKNEAKRYIQSEGIGPAGMRIIRDYAGDPASQKFVAGKAEGLANFLADTGVPRAVNAGRETPSRQLTPEQLQELLAAYEAAKK